LKDRIIVHDKTYPNNKHKRINQPIKWINHYFPCT